MANEVDLPGPETQPLNELQNTLNIQKYYFMDNQPVKLSNREMECLVLYIRGMSTSQIAQCLNVKKATADTFMRNIKTKFKSGSRSELFANLWSLGILQTSGVFD